MISVIFWYGYFYMIRLVIESLYVGCVFEEFEVVIFEVLERLDLKLFW